MKSKLLAILAIAVLSAPFNNVTAAFESSWLYPALKVDNPNKLAVFVGVQSACHYTEEEARELVSGVLIRSRIKPLLSYDDVLNADLYLSVELECIETENQILIRPEYTRHFLW